MQGPETFLEVDISRGSRIAAAMEQRGLKYNCQLCYDIGVSESTLSRWRAGRPLSLHHAIALSYGLGVSLDYLLTGTEPQGRNFFEKDLDRFSQLYLQLDSEARCLFTTLLRNLTSRIAP